MFNEKPEYGYIESIEPLRTRRPSITFIVDRNVVAPVIFRNSSSERAETMEFGEELHAQVNPEKFVSRERLTGLALLRQLSEEFGDENDIDWTEFDFEDEIPAGLIANDEYTYNDPADLNVSLNHDSLTYGLVGTDGDDFGIKSRVVQGYSFSLNEYDVLDGETRNAVYETGTMKDEDNDQSSSLYEIVPVKPDNRFLHFVTVEAATIPMATYVLHNLLNTGRYGARDTRTGKTIDNNVLGVIVSKHPVNLSTAEYMQRFGKDLDHVGEYVEEASRGDWNIYGEFDEFEEFPEWYREMERLARREDEEQLYELLRTDLETSFDSMFEHISN
jgi:CRISPR-associated protein Csc2